MKNKLWFPESAKSLAYTLNFIHNLKFTFEDLFEVAEDDARYVQLKGDVIHPKTGQVLETKRI